MWISPWQGGYNLWCCGGLGASHSQKGSSKARVWPGWRASVSPLVVGDLGSVVGFVKELPDSQRPLRAALSVNRVGWTTHRGCTEVPHSSRPAEQQAGYHTSAKIASESLLRIWTALNWQFLRNEGHLPLLKITCVSSREWCLRIWGACNNVMVPLLYSVA